MKLGTTPETDRVFYCGRNLGTDLIPGSNGRCGPGDGPQCPDCRASQDPSKMKLNADGYPMSLGTDVNLHYCGRFLGKDKIPRSDGRCGPTNGRQCTACAHPGRNVKKPSVSLNRSGVPMHPGTQPGSRHMLYCGRFLGVDLIPGSNGRCGPNGGPNCYCCRAANPSNKKRNKDGVLMSMGTSGRYYCGRFLGKDQIPGSDGRCGPTNGSQCKSCRASLGLA